MDRSIFLTVRYIFLISLYFSCSSIEKISVRKDLDFRNPMIKERLEKEPLSSGLYVFQTDSTDPENERITEVISELHRFWKRAGGRHWAGNAGEKIPENTVILKTEFEIRENEITAVQKLLHSDQDQESAGRIEFGFRKKKNTGLYAYIHDKIIKNDGQEKFESYELFRVPGMDILKNILKNSSSGTLSVLSREKNAKMTVWEKNSVSKKKTEIRKIPSDHRLPPGDYSAVIKGRGQKRDYSFTVYPGRTSVIRFEPYARDRSAFFYSNAQGYSVRIGNDYSRIPASFVRMSGAEEKIYVESEQSGRTSVFLPAEERLSKYLILPGVTSLLSEKNSFIWKTESDSEVETEMKDYISFINHTKQFRESWSGKISHYFVPENAELNAELFETQEMGQGTCFLGISSGNYWYGFIAEEDRISVIDTVSSPKPSASYRLLSSERKDKRKVSFRISRAENRIELLIAGETVHTSWISPDHPFRIGAYAKGGIFNRISFLRTLDVQYEF